MVGHFAISRGEKSKDKRNCRCCQKGGAGKTAACANLGIGLAQEGKRFVWLTVTRRVPCPSAWVIPSPTNCP